MQKIIINQNITEISFKEEWQNNSVAIYAGGLGKVRDLIKMLPMPNTVHPSCTVSPFSVFRTPLFFLDGAKKESYEAVQILSSLGVYSGIVINENADWEKLTDLMLYALCGRVARAPIEPFQYLFDVYERNKLADYGVVYEAERGERRTENGERQRFFYEPTPCAACAGWRICLGKYENLKDKTGCKNFTNEWLNVMEGLKFKDLKI